MTIADYLTMFASSLCVVFLLGIQSKNVMNSRYLAAVLTSAGINVAQFIFVKYAAAGALSTLAVTTAGGCTGIACAILFYDHVLGRKAKTPEPS